MQLLPEWKRVLRRAWSVRLAVLSGALSVAEVVLPLYSDAFARGTFAALSGLVAVASVLVRLVSQPEMHQ